MNKTIDGKVYDTSTAQTIASWGNNKQGEDGLRETLYRKKTGEYFLYSEQSESKVIVPLQLSDAKRLAEGYLTNKELEEIFGGIDDYDISRNKMFSVMIPDSLLDAMRERKNKTGISIAEQIIDALRKAGYEENIQDKLTLAERMTNAREKAKARNSDRAASKNNKDRRIAR